MKQLTTKKIFAAFSSFVLVSALASMTGIGAFADESAPAAEPASSGAAATQTVRSIKGDWIDSPKSAISGQTIVSSKWYLNINSSAQAPTNKQTADNVVTFTARNGQFTGLPDSCEGKSKISPDASTLICDLGKRLEGTATAIVIGTQAAGKDGSKMQVVAEFGGHSAETSEIPVTGVFQMSAVFNGGTPYSYIGNPSDYSFLEFPFAIRQLKGSSAGPDTVTYKLRLDLTRASNQKFELQDNPCVPNDRSNPGYPYSQTGHVENQTANTPTCELKSDGDNDFTLTVRGLKYDGKSPALDSVGNPLPLGWDYLTSGVLRFKTRYMQAGIVNLSVSPVTYRSSESDSQYTDDNATWHANKVALARGQFIHGWWLPELPKSYSGSAWTNTFKVPVGANVLSLVGDVPAPSGQLTNNWVCQVIDSNYVDFKDAWVVTKFGRKPLYYDRDSYHGKIWYYTGDFVDMQGQKVDPNNFPCGGLIDTNSGQKATNQPGWTDEKPADLSKVKAVKAEITKEMAAEATGVYSEVVLMVEGKIKESTQVGQDVYSWGSSLDNGRSDWNTTINQNKQIDFYNRGMDFEALDPAPWPRLKTPSTYRYPYVGWGRDVLQVVASGPVVSITPDQLQYAPGSQAGYTLKYGLTTGMSNPHTADVEVSAILAKGLTYVPGSASAGEPVITTDERGRSNLTWSIKDVMPNKALGQITFKVEVPATAKGGDHFATSATNLSQGNKASALSTFVVPQNGYTLLLKQVAGLTPLEPAVAPDAGENHGGEAAGNSAGAEPAPAGSESPAPAEPVSKIKTLPVSGQGLASWNVTLTSHDTQVSTNTDVIDILPANADPMGSKFSGSATLEKVEAPEGAKIYYTTAPTDKLSEDPADASNGGLAAPSNIWSDKFDPHATAVRVIGGQLLPSQASSFTVYLKLDGVKDSEVLVNKAVGRASSTQLPMRTSAPLVTSVEKPPAPVVPPVEPINPPVNPPVNPPMPPVPSPTPANLPAPVKPAQSQVPPVAVKAKRHLAKTGFDDGALLWAAVALGAAGAVLASSKRRRRSHQ